MIYAAIPVQLSPSERVPYNLHPQNRSLTQKRSIEVELVGVDDVVPQIIWNCYFLEQQLFSLTDNILCQKNQSTMELEENDCTSSGKQTCHINIRYFFVTDNIKSGEIDVKYCPTKMILAKVYSKPLQCRLF